MTILPLAPVLSLRIVRMAWLLARTLISSGGVFGLSWTSARTVRKCKDPLRGRQRVVPVRASS